MRRAWRLNSALVIIAYCPLCDPFFPIWVSSCSIVRTHAQAACHEAVLGAQGLRPLCLAIKHQSIYHCLPLHIKAQLPAPRYLKPSYLPPTSSDTVVMSMTHIERWARSLPDHFAPPFTSEVKGSFPSCEEHAAIEEDAWSIPSSSSVSSPRRSVSERASSMRPNIVFPRNGFVPETAWMDDDGLSSLSSLSDDTDDCLADAERQPNDIHEPWPYTFKKGDVVWVKSKTGTWYHGRVLSQCVRKAQTHEQDQIPLYSVIYRKFVRRCFSPMLGEIKPDTPHIRSLLLHVSRHR